MTSTQALLKRIAARAEAEPENVLPALRVLAGEAPYPETDADAARGEADPTLQAIAIEVNRARLAQARADFIANAWPTERVAEHLGVKSRQAVAQRRARGTLLGAKVGGVTYYPMWQFGPAGVAADLDRLLAELPARAETADDIMRMTHGELDGRSLAQVFAAGEWELVLLWVRDIVGAEEARGSLRR